MTIVSRLKQGDMAISEEVNERLPSITNGLIAHFPFDGTSDGMVTGSLYEDPKIWHTGDYIDAKLYPLSKPGNYDTVVLEADIYIEAVPVERYTVLETPHQAGNLYLSIDNSMKVSAYNHLKASSGYHASSATLQLHTWHRVTHINTPTETIIMVDGVVDRVLSNAYKSGTTFLSISNVMIGAENANRHFQGHIKNIKVGITDPRSSATMNTTFTMNGVAIEEPTTNYLVDGLNGYTALQPSHWSGDGEFKQVGVSPLNTPIIRYGANGSSYRYTHDYILDNNLTTLSGKTVTFSLYLRRLEGAATARIRVYDNVTGYSYQSVSATDQFQKFEMTKTIGTSPTRMFVMIDNTGGGTYEFHSPQVEQKSFATSFVNGSRGAPQLEINQDIVSFDEGTIACKFTPSKGFFTTNHWNRVFGHSTGTNKNEIQVKRNSTGSNLVMSISNNAGTPQSTWSSCPSANLVAGQEYHVVARWSISQGTMSLTVDGVKNEQTWTSGYKPTVRGVVDVGLHSFTSRIANGEIADFSIYDRALYDEEVKRLHANTFSIGKEGVIRSTVKEGPMQPKGVYFPFGSDASGQDGGIEPVKNDNEAYQDGALWIGRGTTNYASNACSVYGAYYTYSREGDRHFAYRQSGSTSATLALQCPSFTSALTSGVTYTISGYLYLNDKPFQTTVPDISTQHRTTVRRRSESNGYFEYTQTYVSGGWVIHSNLCSAAIGDTIELRNLQMEIQPVGYAFATDSRGDSEIVLPYDVIDCKQDFTITGWFFPKVFADGSYRPYLTRNRITSNVTSQRILIMGNGTTSRQLRCWFGSPAGGETSVYAPTSVNVVDNQWNFFCLRRSGNTMSLFAGVNGQIAYGTNTSGANLNTDQDASTWGWLVGKYSDAGNMGVGYARDYNFTQRALSDAEIQSVYRTQMRASKENTLHIQGQLKEGEVL